jgi:exosortase
MLPRTLTRNGWTIWHVGALLVLTTLGVVCTYGAWHDIFQRAWRDEEQSHILLVPIVAAWLVWVRRERFRRCKPTASFIGPALILLGWFFYSFGDLQNLDAISQGGAVLLVLGCALSVLGRDVVWEFLPALVVLAFMVPVPGRVRAPIAHSLETATAQVTQVLLEVLGTPIERSGNVLSIHGVPVTIAEACNGLRMVFALVLVSYAFSFGTPLRNYVRFLILAASPLSAIVCNVIRLVPTVWVYGNYSKETGQNFHDISGWLMLPIAFLLLMGIVRLLRWALVPVNRYTLIYD